MNYRHLYHAGSFSDVIKHVVLIVLLQALKRKETPFCFLDTHAGIGLYELESQQAQKSQEYETGIAKLLTLNKNTLPPALQQYLAVVAQFNSSDAIKIYPGSPIIAENILRSQDQMILCELHREDCQTLKDNFHRAKNVAIHHMNSYLGMKAFLPPKLKRGLVLIDPAFEVVDEFSPIFQALQHALTHWRAGHFMIWYPIKNKSLVENFYKNLKKLDAEKLMIHFALNEITEPGKLSACGIVLINPPWQVKEHINMILPFIASALNATGEFVL